MSIQDLPSNNSEENSEHSEGETTKNVTVQNDVEAGKHVRRQLSFWDKLIEWRIGMQKLLVSSNRLPQHDVWPSISSEKSVVDAQNTTVNGVLKMLETLLDVQQEMVNRNKQLFNPSTDPDEEIPSDDDGDEGIDESGEDDDEDMDPEEGDDEESDGGDDEQETSRIATPEPQETSRKRKLTLSSANKIVSESNELIKKIRNQVVDDWYHKTRFTTGVTKKDVSKSLESFEQPPTVQIQQIISNKKRLISRTQLKRSEYKIIGQSEEKFDKNDPETNTGRKKDDDYDVEIFDDDDFYHQMLRELIESKSSESTDSLALSRKWLEIQKMRSKMKKKVDTKASKGRKIRYEIHKELLNFMAPLINYEVTEESKDELFKSLFQNK